MSETKRCSKCGEEKTLSAFQKDSQRPDGLHGQCKKCRSLHMRNYRGGVRRRDVKQMKTNKTRKFEFCMTEEEHRALELIAQHDHRKRSEAMRDIVRSAAKAYGLWPPPQATDLDGDGQ